ncbi:L,D-transpeptidase [Corynebacterium heidelbergense]|nr:L,D-transpeptidase [Corynebacterium heidelbergense]
MTARKTSSVPAPRRGTVRRFRTGLAVAGALAIAATAAPMAAAQPAAPVPGSSQQQQQDAANQFNGAVLGARDALHSATQGLPPELRDQVNQGVDNSVDFIAPGALAAREAARQPAPAPTPAPAPAPAPPSPCPASAHACVDLDGHTSWLQDGGQRSYGPVPISSGSADQPTPRGSFHVVRKVENEVSREFNNAPMPYSVYFTNQGHAFHAGSPSVESAGCIHLNNDSAKKYFDSLNIGDEVFIY